MNVSDLREHVTELCLSGLLRCLRSKATSGMQLSFNKPLDTLNDELLRLYWALSSGIEHLASTVVQSARRLTTSFTFEEVERVGEITGSVNASASVIAQARTQNPAIFVVTEPNTTALSEPNHLVAWVLSEALSILLAARRTHRDLNKFEWFNSRVSLLEQSLRNEVLAEVIATRVGRRRPGRAVLRAAAKARVPIYQEALELYHLLEAIENGQQEAICECLSSTIIAHLEYWQRLELATALLAAETLGRYSGKAVNIYFPIVTGRPIATVDNFSIYWQYPIPRRDYGQLDLAELWASEIASFLGVSNSSTRSDIAICCDQQVVALFECKYFENPKAASEAILDAANQITRYARDVYPDSLPDAEQLIGRSCIVVADRGDYAEVTVPHAGHRSIYFTDVRGLSSNSLRCWAIDLLLKYGTLS
jgi:hypothetical protein